MKPPAEAHGVCSMRSLFCLALFLLFAGAKGAGATTYYAHPECSDNPSSPIEQVGTYDCSAHVCTDADPASDACFIRRAAAFASADGDVVELEDGTYLLKQPVIFPDRTATTYIKAAHAGAVTITSAGALTKLFDMGGGNGSDNWQIEGLLFDGNGKTATGIEASSVKVKIYNNTFRNCDHGISAGGAPAGKGKDIQGNLFYHCSYAMVWSGDWYDTTVKNNTIVDNDHVLYFSGYWMTGSIFTNNLIAWNNGTSGEQILFTNLPETFLNNNVYSDQTAARAYDFITWRYEGFPGSVDASNLSLPPNFVDRAGGDYSLAPGSPLIDKGVASSLSTDLAGNGRNQGNGVDIGCYESPYTGCVTYSIATIPNKVVVIGNSIAAGYSAVSPSVGMGTDATDPSQAGTPAKSLHDLLGPSWTVINWGVPGLHSVSMPLLAYRALEEDPEWVIVGPGWINTFGWPTATVNNITPAYFAECAKETVRVLKNAGVESRKIILVGMLAEDSQPDQAPTPSGHYASVNMSAAEIRDVLVDVAVAEDVLFVDAYHIFAGTEIPNWNTTFFNNVDNDVHPNVLHGYPLLGRLWYNMISMGGAFFIRDGAPPTNNEISVYPLCEDARSYTNSASNGCILTSDNTSAGVPFTPINRGAQFNQKILDLPGVPDTPVRVKVDPTMPTMHLLTLEEDGNNRNGTEFNLELGSSGKRTDITIGAMEYGGIHVGSSSPSHVFTIRNEGTEVLDMGTVSIAGGDATQFVLQGDTCTSISLLPAQTCQVRVAFAPGTAGTKSARLSIPFVDVETTRLDLPLTGTGIDPDDFDADGHKSISAGGDDCNDTDSTVYGGALELCDGQDNDCDTVTPPDEVDDDSDGYVECTLDTGGWDGAVSKLGNDCDDSDPSVHPGGTEGPFGDLTCSDLKDNDCNGAVDSLDRACMTTGEVIGYVREVCAGYTNCYNSLQAWQQAKGGIDFTGCSVGDLVCANKIAVAQIDGAWTNPDTATLTIDGWTTDATRYVRIYTTPAARHNGIWGNGYRLQTTARNTIMSSHVKLEGLAISTGTNNVDTLAVIGSGTTDVEIGYCLVINGNTSTNWRNAFYTYDLGAGNSVRLYNSIFIVNSPGASSTAIEAYLNGTIYASNVTGVNKTTGSGYVFKANSGGDIVAYNCLGQKGTNGAVFGLAAGTMFCSYCASTDDTADNFGGTGNRISQVFSFINAASDNYHLDPSDGGARDHGGNADPNFTFVDDIDGSTRTGVWDIGADEMLNCAVDDATCDGVDDDCDGDLDEDYVSTPTFCGTGACASSGQLECQSGMVADTCTPGVPAADDVTCDGIDDDCDGLVDEDYVVNAACGVGACRTNNTPSTCAGGVETLCQPGVPLSPDDATCNGIDDDCDGLTDEDCDTDGDGLPDMVDPLPLYFNYRDGDVDASGAVDIADALIAMRITSGLEPPSTLQLQHGDVTPAGAPDGAIDISDALVIMRKAMGLVSF